MNWLQLDSIDKIVELKKESESAPILIFKHSTRCPISAMALDRLERSWDETEMKGVRPFLLDLISYRDISNKIAQDFTVMHQSPQVLLINKGNAVYDDSHMGISYKSIKKELGRIKN